MVDDILTYIGTYDEIRAICGLNSKELKNETLSLTFYQFKLSQRLQGVTGDYPEGTGDENLEQIFARIEASDEMHYAIKLYSIYAVSDAVMESIGLRAFKVQSDGKSNLTRFSPESTYRSVRTAIKQGLSSSRRKIGELLGETVTDLDPMLAVPPLIDPVTGV